MLISVHSYDHQRNEQTLKKYNDLSSSVSHFLLALFLHPMNFTYSAQRIEIENIRFDPKMNETTHSIAVY